MLKQLLSMPGFVYDLGGKYYYLGKWICKECTNVDATDCVVMYSMCRSAKEENETGYYFQKLRAYSDLSLEIPYNPALIHDSMEALLDSLTEDALEKLSKQINAFSEDLKKYA